MSIEGSSHFAYEMQGLSKLKVAANMDQHKGLKGASQQFEALFLQQMMKAMRATVPQSDLLGSQATELYTEMYDAQLAQNLAGRGIGLAELIEQHMLKQGLIKENPQETNEQLIVGIPQANPRMLEGGMRTPSPALDIQMMYTPRHNPFSPQGEVKLPSHVAHFVNKMEGPARFAASVSGIDAELILAQAALETGWGKSSIKTSNGGDSHNLFGIKAGKYWTGPTADIVTTEYVNNKPQKIVDRFRVYGSDVEAFADYARLISKNPRYSEVVKAPNAVAAAHELQRAGYATDPAYGDKLASVMKTIQGSSGQRLASNADGEALRNKIW